MSPLTTIMSFPNLFIHMLTYSVNFSILFLQFLVDYEKNKERKYPTQKIKRIGKNKDQVI